MKGGSRGSGQRKTPHAAATFGVLTGLVGSRPPDVPGEGNIIARVRLRTLQLIAVATVEPASLKHRDCRIGHLERLFEAR